ncbi:MAG: metallophosphoesterase family protein [Geobacter sp.]|nr:metallophosphoesterase family protein [Geobacter sp.]
MNRYVIGNIHGGSQTLQALIDQINPKHDDRLYLLGDYIDRGPDSKGVLDIIIGMQEAGYNVRPIRGNHEDMLIRNLSQDHDLFSCQWVKNWGQKTLFSFGVKQPADISLRYRKFLACLPYCYEDGDFILVHAGIDLGLDDPVNDTPVEHLAWGSTVIPENYDKTHRVICGHRIKTLDEIIHSRNQQVICLDNGAFTNQQLANGNLIALNLETMKLTMQPWIDRKAEW